MSLDKLNPALLRTDGASDGDALVFSAANARLEFKTAISASDFAANDYSTYTTLQSEYSANDYNTLLSAQSNDFITYTTLLGRLDIVQDNVAAAAGGGDALGVVSNNTLDLSTGNFFEVTADDQTLTFSNPPAAHAFSIKVTGAGTVSGFDLSIASYAQSFSVLGQDPFAHDLFFKSDGAKMYVLGAIGDDVNEYDLSTAWDISTASYLQNFSVVAQGNTPTGLFFHPDGIKMYVICQSSDSIHEYNLSTAWDISTAAFVQSFSVTAQDTDPTGLAFNSDGTKMFVVGNGSDSVHQYTLTTGFDVSTASYDSVSFSVAAQDASPTGLAFSSDGTKMYFVGRNSDRVYSYTLSSGYDISTAVYDSVSFSVAGQETFPTGLAFNSDGDKMYVVGISTDAPAVSQPHPSHTQRP
jgi:DNA-binding beta-propeller fold protein YncE